MAEQKEKKLKEEDLKLLEESKKKREETQRYRYFFNFICIKCSSFLPYRLFQENKSKKLSINKRTLISRHILNNSIQIMFKLLVC